MASAKKKIPCIDVSPAKATKDTVSRLELFAWFNRILGTAIWKVNHLASGDAYCMMMAKAFPGCLPTGKVILEAVTVRERMKNMELLARGLQVLGVKKNVDWELLAEGRNEDNIKFAQWLKKLVDANTGVNTSLIGWKEHQTRADATKWSGPPQASGGTRKTRACTAQKRNTVQPAGLSVNELEKQQTELQEKADKLKKEVQKQRVKLQRIRQLYQEYEAKHGAMAPLMSVMEMTQTENVPPVKGSESKCRDNKTE